MITRFSTLYVGHIELDPVASGHAGDRRYSNDRLIEAFTTAEALARAADTLGYETLWLASITSSTKATRTSEHSMLAVDLAHRTKRVKIGCAFTGAHPHPLRIAEDMPPRIS
jgi:alkanesulfonate monooxygenase SsuD/methylene tetrahydromethanopterin reductase-like flavin-dependent oxidoreductase (luciferase family)